MKSESWLSARRATAIVAAAALAALLVGGLVAYHRNHETATAEAKADQLIAALGAAGLPAPSKDQVVRLLGDDGGAACADPGAALARAALYRQLSNGAGGPGVRPVIADGRVVRAGAVVLGVYCPDQLPAFTEFVDKLKYADVAALD